MQSKLTPLSDGTGIEEVLAEAQKWGVRELPMGRNWLALPDGLELELMQAHANSVAEALAVKPRA